MKNHKYPCKSALLSALLALAIGTPVASAQTSASTVQSGASNAGGQSTSSQQTTTSGQSGTAGTAPQQNNQTGKGASSAQSSEGSASGNKQNQSAQSGAAQQGGKSNNAKAPIYLLVPIDVASQEKNMKSGCWARVYSGNNFTGDALTLTGAMSLADMSGPFGMDWDDKVKSIETGKAANVQVYDNEGFRDPVAQFKPGAKIADVSKRMGFFDEFASIRINCSKS